MLEEKKNDPRNIALRDLERVTGIGPKKAADLFDNHGIMSLEGQRCKEMITYDALLCFALHCSCSEDLRASEHLLNDKQKLGLKYAQDFEIKIHRLEMIRLSQVVEEAARQIDPRFRCTTAGSFRRGAPESGDIDIILSHPDHTEPKTAFAPYRALIEQLRQQGFLVDSYADGSRFRVSFGST